MNVFKQYTIFDSFIFSFKRFNKSNTLLLEISKILARKNSLARKNLLKMFDSSESLRRDRLMVLCFFPFYANSYHFFYKTEKLYQDEKVQALWSDYLHYLYFSLLFKIQKEKKKSKDRQLE